MVVKSLPCSNLAGVAAPIIVPELRLGQKKFKIENKQTPSKVIIYLVAKRGKSPKY